MAKDVAGQRQDDVARADNSIVHLLRRQAPAHRPLFKVWFRSREERLCNPSSGHRSFASQGLRMEEEVAFDDERACKARPAPRPNSQRRWLRLEEGNLAEYRRSD